MKRYILIVLTFAVCPRSTIAGPTIRWNQTYQNYFDKYKNLAIKEMQRYGIPASITLAQGVLESGAGQSKLAIVASNHFGIKCHDWTGRTISHDDDLTGECFRAYDTVLDSFEDHSKFLSGRKRYNCLFNLSKYDYRGWAHGLKRAGYATNPQYAYKLIEIIEVYKLYQYDNAKFVEPFEPTRPEITKKPTSKQNMLNTGLRNFRAFNENCYVTAHAGDTYKDIAKEVNISEKKLAKYNEQDIDKQLYEGEIVWLRKKQKHAPSEYRNRPHIVQPSESLYDISQKYGIRLKNLIKMNKKLVKRGICTNDKIRLY